MATSLEEYVAQATNAYKPSATAIQAQIDALAGRLDATNEAINRNYAQQQADLNTASNQAAETASMQAAGSGGSFGGAANIANRKYYEQSFVPAVTRLKTNQANDLAAARQANEDTRNTLTQQLANLQSQAGSQAWSQYYTDLGEQQAREFQQLEAEKNRQFQSGESEKSRAFEAEQAKLSREFQAAQSELDRQFNEAQAQLNREWQDYLADKQYKHEAVEAEKVREFQAAQAELERQYNAEQSRLDREFQASQNAANRAIQQQQIASQNAYNEYLMKAAQQANNANSVKSWDFGNGYSIVENPNTGLAMYVKNGEYISPGQFLEGTGASGANWDLWYDVWNSGVGTSGVGSDTIEAFNRKSPNSSNYNYLYQ